MHSCVNLNTTDEISVPRIVLHAMILPHVRRPSIWYRPEPRHTAIPRPSTLEELLIASLFKRYIRQISDRDPKVKLISGASVVPQPPISHAVQSMDLFAFTGLQYPRLELKPCTPQFYRKMASHQDLAEFLRHALTLTYWMHMKKTARHGPMT